MPFQLTSSPCNVNILMRERERTETTTEEAYGGASGLKRARWDRERERERERDDLTPPAWFSNHIQQAEDREQRRWEEEKALRLREMEVRRDLDIQKIQAMKQLTSALGSFLQRTNNARPSSL
jgi:hypothetical protein